MTQFHLVGKELYYEDGTKVENNRIDGAVGHELSINDPNQSNIIKVWYPLKIITDETLLPNVKVELAPTNSLL